jgi:SAM-dependent methyltransferase
MSADTPSHWNEKYLAGTIPWDRGEVSPALLHWLETGDLSPCRILVPGCGRGHEATELARRGFEVTALDIAPAALAHLKSELDQVGAQAELVAADALTWQPAHPFDAIYEQTCLCALQPDDWPAYERQLHRWLKLGGKLFALFMQTQREGGPPFHCALPDMRRLFPESRWRWPVQLDREVPHPNGVFEYAGILERMG